MNIANLTERHVFVKIVEFFPPSVNISARTTDLALDLHTRVRSLIDKARLVESVSDAILIAQPKDITRYHLPSVLLAAEVKKSTGIEAIPTIPLRDYNRNALRGLILYGLYAGLENICIVRGDPFLPEEKNYSRNVYDLKSVADGAKLVKEIVSSTSRFPTCILGPIDLSGKLDEHYIDLICERQTSGVDAFICQPFFGLIEDCLERIDRLRAGNVTRPILHNVFPLKGFEDAVKMESKFSWHIGKQIKEKLREGGLQIGLELARERYRSFLENRGKVDGVYISSRGNADWVVAILT